MADTDYAILVHPRITDSDPTTGVVIYCTNGTYWHPMVTGEMDWCNEVLDALCYREHDRREKAVVADDIVTRLRSDELHETWRDEVVSVCLDAADEIERLRATGDALAAAMRSGSDTGWDAAIDTWEDARRG